MELIAYFLAWLTYNKHALGVSCKHFFLLFNLPLVFSQQALCIDIEPTLYKRHASARLFVCARDSSNVWIGIDGPSSGTGTEKRTLNTWSGPTVCTRNTDVSLALRKHAIQIYWKFSHQKWKLLGKKFWYFSYFCSKTDCGYSLEPPRRGGSNEYQQSIFLSRNKKNNVYLCKPQFYYI